jgi:TonB-like protein
MTTAGLALLVALLAPSALLGQRKSCSETKYPKKLPAPRETIDSADAIAKLKASDRLAQNMLFSLMYAEGDSLPLVRALEGADPQAALLLYRSARPLKPSGLWAVRVRVVGGDAPALTIERSIFCPPESEPGLHEGIPVRVMVEGRPGDRPPPASGRVRIGFEVLVGADGTALRVRMLQSSGLSDLDEQLVRELQQRHFQPALLDGAPIQALYRTDGLTPRL